MKAYIYVRICCAAQIIVRIRMIHCIASYQHEHNDGLMTVLMTTGCVQPEIGTETISVQVKSMFNV